MKINIIIFFVLLLILSSGFAQPIYFNKQYNPNNTWAAARSIISNDSFYIIAAVGGNQINFYQNNILLIKMNHLGNISHVKNYEKELTSFYCGSGGSLQKLGNGDYLLGGGCEQSTKNYSILALFSNSGDTNWIKPFEDTSNINQSWIAGFQAKSTSNNQFILAGEVDVNQNNSWFFIIKTDSLGNQLWRKTYGNPNNKNRCENVLVTPDGGYLMGGISYKVTQGNSINSMIIKTDSAGNQQWIKTYGGPYNDGYARLALTNDGNYMIGTTYQTDPSSAGVNKINFIKIDTNGNEIWNKKYCKPRLLTRLNSIKALPDGSFIAVGDTHESDTTTYDHFGWIMKINANGDSVWYREYSNYNSGLYRHELYDITQTNDGGFIACGDINDDSLNLFYDMWVLKLDSNGCLNSGCITGIETPTSSSQSISIYPNPAKNNIAITFKYELLDESSAAIYEMTGKKVKEVLIPKNQKNFNVNISDLEEGIYLLQLPIENSILSSKFIVQ